MNKDRGLNYGIIGNCKSSALINENSSIDWCCLPQFDSSSVFCKILDKDSGGSLKIECNDDFIISQKYLENTAIIITTFKNDNSEFDVVDFMPRFKDDNNGYYSSPEIQRILIPKKGTPSFKVAYTPKLDYAKGKTKNYIKKNFIVSVLDEEIYETLFLYSNIDKKSIIDSKEIYLNEIKYINLSYNEKIDLPSIENSLLEYEKT